MELRKEHHVSKEPFTVDARIVIVILFSLFFALVGPCARAQDKEGVRGDGEPNQASRPEAKPVVILDPLPKKVTYIIALCIFGSGNVPCTKLSVEYDDGTVTSKNVAMSPKGDWEFVCQELGKELNLIQKEYERRLAQRKKP